MSNAQNDPRREVRLGDLLTAEEAGERLGIDARTIRRWGSRKGGPRPAIDKGERTKLYYLPDLVNWCKWNKRGPYRKSVTAGEVRTGEKGKSE